MKRGINAIRSARRQQRPAWNATVEPSDGQISLDDACIGASCRETFASQNSANAERSDSTLCYERKLTCQNDPLHLNRYTASPSAGTRAFLHSDTPEHDQTPALQLSISETSRSSYPSKCNVVNEPGACLVIRGRAIEPSEFNINNVQSRNKKRSLLQFLFQLLIHSSALQKLCSI